MKLCLIIWDFEDIEALYIEILDEIKGLMERD